MTRDRVWIPARAQEGGGSECPGHVEVSPSVPSSAYHASFPVSAKLKQSHPLAPFVCRYSTQL